MKFDTYYESNELNHTITNILSDLGYPIENIIMFTNWFKGCGKTFLGLDYEVLPIYDNSDDYTEEKHSTIISQLFSRKLIRYSFLLSAISVEVNNFTFRDGNGHRKTSYGKIDTNSGKDTRVIEKDKSRTLTNSGKDSSSEDKFYLSENAPINSDYLTINTPNFKEGSKNSSEFTHGKITTDVEGGSDTDETTYGKVTTEGGNDTTSDPYMLEVFIRVAKEHNLYEKIIECYKGIIREFNTAL